MNGKLVKVIIPIYKPQLKDYERAALDNNLRLLEGFPVTFLKPEHTDMTELHEQYPAVGMQSVSDEWLGTKKGIQGYNEMMMSEKFYEIFSDYEYILICHVDAWLFRNELVEWCRKRLRPCGGTLAHATTLQTFSLETVSETETLAQTQTKNHSLPDVRKDWKRWIVPT